MDKKVVISCNNGIKKYDYHPRYITKYFRPAVYSSTNLTKYKSFEQLGQERPGFKCRKCGHQPYQHGDTLFVEDKNLSRIKMGLGIKGELDLLCENCFQKMRAAKAL